VVAYAAELPCRDQTVAYDYLHEAIAVLAVQTPGLLSPVACTNCRRRRGAQFHATGPG
jgi:hypothetical protein